MLDSGRLRPLLASIKLGFKRYSLLGAFVSYDEKKFSNIGPWFQKLRMIVSSF
jgi:hypothetical protein